MNSIVDSGRTFAPSFRGIAGSFGDEPGIHDDLRLATVGAEKDMDVESAFADFSQVFPPSAFGTPDQKHFGGRLFPPRAGEGKSWIPAFAGMTT